MIQMEQINDQVVGAALSALQNKERNNFEKLVSRDAAFVHNGKPEDLFSWANSFFFGESEVRITVLRQTVDGRTVWAQINSSQAGELQAKLVFKIEDGLITSLNAGKG